jgi:plasmid rolling circle replication initiator protein Rep
MPAVLAAHPSARYVFLTLTIRNCPVEELRETVKLLNDSWKRLMNRKDFPAIGFIRSLEVTRNPKDGTAHPHFHCLLMVRPSYFSTGYITKDEWVKLWQSCLNVDYLPSIDVKVVKPRKEQKAKGSDGLIQALCETLKYSVKEADLVADAQWLDELTKQLHKVRTVSVGGIFKEFLKEDDPEDLIHGDDEPDELLEDAPKLYFDWSTIIKRYTKRSEL